MKSSDQETVTFLGKVDQRIHHYSLRGGEGKRTKGFFWFYFKDHAVHVQDWSFTSLSMLHMEKNTFVIT